MRATQRIIVALSGVLLAGLFVVPTVSAHDHHVPRAILNVGGVPKRLHPWSYEWTSRSGPNQCVGIAADGIPNFRPQAEVPLESRMRVVFRKRQRPRRVHALASHHLTDDGYLANARRLPVELRARERDGHRVWVAIMDATVRHRLFADINAHWPDVDGCGGDQTASWDFRLRRE